MWVAPSLAGQRSRVLPLLLGSNGDREGGKKDCLCVLTAILLLASEEDGQRASGAFPLLHGP